jgi:hypothetical protein
VSLLVFSWIIQSDKVDLTFDEFEKGRWDRVLTLAFAFLIQSLSPKLGSFLIFAQPAADGKARYEQIK